jgi:hypothetical protein
VLGLPSVAAATAFVAIAIATAVTARWDDEGRCGMTSPQAEPVSSSRSTNSSISPERASAKLRSVAMMRKPHYSRTRHDATLS